MTRATVLQTPRLRLTTWLPGDVDALWAVHSDEQTMRFIGHGRPETRDETATRIARYLAEAVGLGFTKWRLADPAGRLVGRAGFGPDGDGRELGYLVRREQRGRGLATEIAGALVTWHRANAPAVPLRAYVAVDNAASHRVLAKVGFEQVGHEDHDGMACAVFRCD
jgi:RimJ/RimL family protein N-acetyltransferase